MLDWTDILLFMLHFLIRGPFVMFYKVTYVVWQKSNENDFLVTMNFIIFTSQGYPLKNSSLWQLHSDGGVVSIVRSSAGRLLLVYLSGRRLRSSGYYPKYQNGALSSGFWAGGIKRIHRDWDPANKGTEEPQECFFFAKNSLVETAVWHGALSLCSIQVGALSGRTLLPFSWVFQGFPDKKFDWQFVLVAQIPCGRPPDCQKNKWASIWF